MSRCILQTCVLVIRPLVSFTVIIWFAGVSILYADMTQSRLIKFLSNNAEKIDLYSSSPIYSIIFRRNSYADNSQQNIPSAF